MFYHINVLQNENLFQKQKWLSNFIIFGIQIECDRFGIYNRFFMNLSHLFFNI